MGLIARRLQEYFISHAFEPSMLLQNITTAVCVLVLFYDFKANRKSLLILIAHAAGIFAALILLNCAYHVIFNTYGNFILTHAVVLVIYALFLCKWRIKPRIITACIFYAAEICLIQFAGIIPRMMAGLSNGPVIEIFIRNGFIVLTAGIAVYQRLFNMNRYDHIPDMAVVLVGAFTAVSLLLVILYNAFATQFNIYSYSFALAAHGGMVAVGLLMYYMVHRICLNHSLNLQLIAEQHIYVRDREMVKMSEKNVEDMRKIRHEIKNQFAYLKLMMKDKRYEEMEKYFEDIEDKATEPLSYIDCGNKNISAVLNLELSKARLEGVSLDTRLIVPPALPFRDSDICSILTNLIDNAIEACVQHKIAEPTVEVGISQKNNNLYICVTNPLPENADHVRILSMRTTKKDKLAHGYGTKIINDIVSKYNGGIGRSIIDGRFVVDVMLDMLAGEQPK